ncbi:PACE efflux transporter [Rhodoferax saidenbachensis]|uniref:Membrane protein n=1 Tax=Rhodoferax saidenbachensis TaxID=1484693 RepID=A0ABU1ZIQ0_9BURK|nr:PACE efflux transporter [Rhodoferax saidenbachensis]MDR7305419.1 putative membrane protein [Rhodoferax saidenbachensis]
MSPITRRIVQAALYESIAIAVVTPTLALAFSHPPGSAFVLSAVMSTIALAWNYVFNSLFERWEASQAVKGRSLARRIAHGVGFEGGLAIILMPMMAWWLDISLWAAFVADLGLLAFFFVYTVAFTWAFDRIFGLPASAS